MTEAEGNQALESIKMKMSMFTFHASFHPVKLLFIARVPLKSKEKKVSKTMSEISESFVGRYSATLENWNNDTSAFNDFTEDLKKYFK